MGRSRTQVFTARLPVEEHAAVSAYAFVSGRSMNDVVVEAVRLYLQEHVGLEDLDAMIDATGDEVRALVRKLRGDA